ncbi:hypothetical protein HNQ02_003204 [Flavobacterium sp. 7E]|nr:hypothetical protein [Flavobacterium sp. PL002]NRS90266.1 hypothetical protein [Flavobacterium sp. 7E]
MINKVTYLLFVIALTKVANKLRIGFILLLSKVIVFTDLYF